MPRHPHATALRRLAKDDPAFAKAFALCGLPPLREREPGCLSRGLWERVRDSITAVLDATTLEDLSRDGYARAEANLITIQSITGAQGAGQPGGDDGQVVAGRAEGLGQGGDLGLAGPGGGHGPGRRDDVGEQHGAILPPAPDIRQASGRPPLTGPAHPP
jgi:hypothetical protein